MPSNILKNKKEQEAPKTLQTVACFCGAKILLVPDVKKMGEAIEAHAKEHAGKLKSKQEKDAEAEKVRDYLIAEVLSKACEA